MSIRNARAMTPTAYAHPGSPHKLIVECRDLTPSALLQEVPAVVIVTEDRTPLVAAAREMIPSPCVLDAQRSRHAPTVPDLPKTMQAPFVECRDLTLGRIWL